MPKREDRRELVRAGDTDLLKTMSTALAPAPKLPNHPRPKPTEHDNPQMNLFRDFLCNTQEERDRLSNAIELWDSVPRYNVNRQAMSRVRENEKFLDNHTYTFHYRGRTYSRTISPARVKDLDGKQRDYYPSVTEELVEEALRKLALDRQSGFFDKPNYRSGVVFSLYELREELRKREHARSYQEIVQALNILSSSIIEITSHDEKGEVVVKSPYLPSLIAVSRSKLQDDPKAKWAVQFHPFVTGSIDQVTYRQFNYALMMKQPTALARWIHKQLAIKYTFADYTKPFEMRYSTVRRDSGLLENYSRERDAVDAVHTAFEDLKKSGLFSSFERKAETGPRKKILDVIFKIWPSMEFIREAKAANKRAQAVGSGRG